MKCPKCGKDDDKVLDSRAAREGAAIRRRRECLSCGYRFTTYEEIDRDEVLVVKGNELYVPGKLQKSPHALAPGEVLIYAGGSKGRK